MVSVGETDANLWALKSRTCEWAIGQYCRGPACKARKTRLNNLLLAWHRWQKDICCCYLLPWALLRLQKFSHPTQRQYKAFKGCHDTWKRLFSWYHCIESTDRGYWMVKLKALSLLRMSKGFTLHPLFPWLVPQAPDAGSPQVERISSPAESAKTC